MDCENYASYCRLFSSNKPLPEKACKEFSVGIIWVRNAKQHDKLFHFASGFARNHSAQSNSGQSTQNSPGTVEKAEGNKKINCISNWYYARHRNGKAFISKNPLFYLSEENADRNNKM